jgi:hypothetical protein
VFVIDEQFEKWLPAVEPISDEELEQAIRTDGLFNVL